MKATSPLFCSVLLVAWLNLPGSLVAAEKATLAADEALVLADRTQPTLAYAADELTHFLEQTTAMAIRHDPGAARSSRWVFQLATDSTLPPWAWEVKCLPTVNQQTVVRLAGHNPTGVLHSVYTMFEKLGVMFDITGPVLPDHLDLRELASWSTRVTPSVALRGIRQHINFPMDISSYPLAEAKEYVRNLGRLRLNLIVFHSYSGQFYECPPLRLQAGNFFYGQRHDLPATPLFRDHVRNRRTYCIPEVEAIYDRKQERSQAAIEWLAEVLRQAKACGFTIQFSFEPPGEKPEDGVAACQSILASYPQIDALELITPENFGTPQKAVARSLAIADRLKEAAGAKCPRMVVGVYETGPGLQEGLRYLRQHCPPDIQWSILPAHGARAVVEALKTAAFTADDWHRSVVYSWVEFDGLMYSQQNSVLGTQQLLDLARKGLGDAPVPAIAFNHWRTAENRTAIRYAARACLESGLTPE